MSYTIIKFSEKSDLSLLNKITLKKRRMAVCLSIFQSNFRLRSAKFDFSVNCILKTCQAMEIHLP
ncbi:Uncharacterised protein [Legionella israelensis]|nr:Uncharacterised protein [Legionella israelensis]